MPTWFEAREIDRLVSLGQTQYQSVFEIMGLKGELTAAQVELRTRFSEGFAAYRGRRWDEARRAFEAALVAIPNDGPSMTFIKRIEKLADYRPAKDGMERGILSISSTRNRKSSRLGTFRGLAVAERCPNQSGERRLQDRRRYIAGRLRRATKPLVDSDASAR